MIVESQMEGAEESKGGDTGTMVSSAALVLSKEEEAAFQAALNASMDSNLVDSSGGPPTTQHTLPDTLPSPPALPLPPTPPRPMLPERKTSTPSKTDRKEHFKPVVPMKTTDRSEKQASKGKKNREEKLMQRRRMVNAGEAGYVAQQVEDLDGAEGVSTYDIDGEGGTKSPDGMDLVAGSLSGF